MSVLQVVSVGSRSGAYGGPFDTAKRQVVLAQESGLAARLWAGSFVNDEPERSSLPDRTILVPVRNWMPAFGFAAVASFGAITSLIREIRKSDIIHVSFSREVLPVVASVIAILCQKRLILQPHGMLTSRTSRLHRSVDLLVKPLLRASHVVVVLTEVEQAHLKTWLGSDRNINWVVMGNPVGRLEGGQQTVRAKPARQEALWVARLHPRKRVQDFLAAAEISQGNSSEVVFAIVGPDGGELPGVLSACRNAANIIYEGSISSDDVTRRVNSTGVFVLTSSNEPWGNVLATALSLGVPVVVTKSSALASAVVRWGAGLIVSDESPAQVEAAIAELLQNHCLYQACSAGALELAAQLLSETAQIERLADLYGRAAV
jgi:glycosyltransferase involved in cell wall biosynthesis